MFRPFFTHIQFEEDPMKNALVKRYDLGEDPILPLLFKLSIPGMVSMSVQAFYNVVDSFFVARVSEEALAALSIAFPFHIILIAIAVGTGIGTNSLISRFLGGKKHDQAVLAAEHVLVISGIYAVLMAVIGLVITEPAVRTFSDNPEIIAYAVQYVRVILVGSGALFFSLITSDILRGQGNTFAPMMAMLLGAVVNIILDPFLIFGIGFFPRLEVLGAAIATVFSKLLGALFILWMLFKGDNQVIPRFRNFHFRGSILKEIYKVGLPAMTMQLLASVMLSGMNLIVSGLDELALAVNGLYFRLQSFVFMPVFGVTQGYIPLMGYNYGYGKPERMKTTLKYGVIFTFIITMSGFVLFQFFPYQLMGLFDSGEELTEIGVAALKTISIGFPVIGPAIIGSTTFQAIGKGMPSLTLSFMRQILLLLPFAYLFSLTGEVNNVWYAFPLSEGITFVVMVFWLGYTFKKELKSLEHNSDTQ